MLKMERRVFLLGYPGGMGGANTEAWSTIRLWRQMGLEVTLVPTWGCDQPMADELTAIGCRTVHVTQDAISTVEGLPGSIVVGMCNIHVMGVYARLREMGCKLVWINCMTFLFDHEHQTFSSHGAADAYIFQSEFQRSELEPQLRKFKDYTPDRGYLIRGAFDFKAVPFAPRSHHPGDDFVVGRLSRPDLDKWSSNHWNILQGVPYAGRRALAMGWNQVLGRKLGTPPAWAETLPPQQIPVNEFLGRCHAMLGLNGGARENWPRIGLEAMAAGVPLVVQNLWGWREMVQHEQTGLLCDNDQEMQYWLSRLAMDEEFRQHIIQTAREEVFETLANPEKLSAAWWNVLESLGMDRLEVRESAA